MFPLFHIAIPLLLFEIPRINHTINVNRAVLIVASMLPDIIDKTLLFLGLGSGRDISHTLIFWAISSFLLYFVSKKGTPITGSYSIGIGFHLLLDLPYIPLFYPFISYDFPITEEPLLVWLNSILTNPIVIGTELIGASILIFIFFKHNLRKRENFISFLKTTSLSLEKGNKTK